MESTDQPQEQTEKPVPKTRLEIIATKVDIWTKIATLVLLVVAAWAGYVSYIYKDLPDINKAFKMEHNFRIDSFTEKRCAVTAHIALENSGKCKLRVDSIYIYRWVVGRAEIGGGDYFDLAAFIKEGTQWTEPIYGYNDTTWAPLIGTYDAGDVTDWDFPFYTDAHKDSAFIFHIVIKYSKVYKKRPCPCLSRGWGYLMHIGDDLSEYEISYSEFITTVQPRKEEPESKK